MARQEVHQAEEDIQMSYNKKKGVAAERKEAKLEQDEAERYQKLTKQYVSVRDGVFNE